MPRRTSTYVEIEEAHDPDDDDDTTSTARNRATWIAFISVVSGGFCFGTSSNFICGNALSYLRLIREGFCSDVALVFFFFGICPG